MSYFENKCLLFRLTEVKDIEGFSCGEGDFDDFFTSDCFAFERQLLGKTYC